MDGSLLEFHANENELWGEGIQADGNAMICSEPLSRHAKEGRHDCCDSKLELRSTGSKVLNQWAGQDSNGGSLGAE